MNIQFMTEKNAKIIKDSWTGEDKTVYVPDFEELVKKCFLSGRNRRNQGDRSNAK